jgi:hypothetical protein
MPRVLGGRPRRRTSQARGGGRCGTAGHAVEVVDHHVQVAVVVQVGQGHGLRDAAWSKPQAALDFLEGQVAAVAEGDVGVAKRGKARRNRENLGGSGPGRRAGAGGTAMSSVRGRRAPWPLGQQVLVAVQVHVQEHAGPGPLERPRRRRVGRFGVGAVAAIEEGMFKPYCGRSSYTPGSCGGGLRSPTCACAGCARGSACPASKSPVARRR